MTAGDLPKKEFVQHRQETPIFGVSVPWFPLKFSEIQSIDDQNFNAFAVISVSSSAMKHMHPEFGTLGHVASSKKTLCP